jgi:hypothetical protein
MTSTNMTPDALAPKTRNDLAARTFRSYRCPLISFPAGAARLFSASAYARRIDTRMQACPPH